MSTPHPVKPHPLSIIADTDNPLQGQVNSVQFVTLQAGSNDSFPSQPKEAIPDNGSPMLLSSNAVVSGQVLVDTVGNLTIGNLSSPALRTMVSSILKVLACP